MALQTSQLQLPGGRGHCARPFLLSNAVGQAEKPNCIFRPFALQ